MATLTITIPDASVTRVRAAFGHPASMTDPTWVPATTAEVQAHVTEQINLYVRRYEERLAAQSAVGGVTDTIPS